MSDTKDIVKVRLLGVLIGTAIGVPLTIYLAAPSIAPLNKLQLLSRYVLAVLTLGAIISTSDIWTSKILNKIKGEKQSTDNTKSS